MRNLICNYCGKHFKGKSVKKYCSEECRRKVREQKTIRVKKNCLWCNKEFFVPPSEGYRKFCSPSCANKYNAKLKRKKRPSKEVLEMLYLKEKLSIRAVAKKLNVSSSLVQMLLHEYNIPVRREAWNKGLKASEDERVKRSTDKTHQITREKYAKGELQPWNKGIGDVIIKCANCGKEFKSLRCKKRKYCSHKCVLQAIARKRKSSLELMIEKNLKSLNLNFKPQYKYNNGRWIADFYLPDYKLFIECDGDYWHSLPERKKVDIEKDAWIIANGYNILRLGETLIRKEIDKCIKKIKEKINWGLTWKKSMK